MKIKKVVNRKSGRTRVSIRAETEADMRALTNAVMSGRLAAALGLAPEAKLAGARVEGVPLPSTGNRAEADSSARYHAATQRFTTILLERRESLKPVKWQGTIAPWDVFCEANPEARALPAIVLEELRYELSERQCSSAVVLFCLEVTKDPAYLAGREEYRRVTEGHE